MRDMLNKKDRDQRFSELQILMADVLAAYKNWQKDFTPGNPLLDELIKEHDKYEKEHLQNVPPDNAQMEDLVIATGIHMQTTQAQIDQLSSVGTFTWKQKVHQIKKYREILLTREKVE